MRNIKYKRIIMINRTALPLFLLISAQHICVAEALRTPPPGALHNPYQTPVMLMRKRESDDTRELHTALRWAQGDFKKLPAWKEVWEPSIWKTIDVKQQYNMSAVVGATRALKERNLVVYQYWVMHPEPMAVMRLYHTTTGQYIESEMPLSHFTPGHGYAPIRTTPAICTWIRLFLYASLVGIECPLEGEEKATLDAKSEPVEGANT